MFKVLERIFKDRLATEEISLVGSERYRGPIEGKAGADVLAECMAVCPVKAFSVAGEDYKIDYKRCIFCGRCVEACAKLVPKADAQAGLSHGHVDAMPYLIEAGQEAVQDVLKSGWDGHCTCGIWMPAPVMPVILKWEQLVIHIMI